MLPPVKSTGICDQIFLFPLMKKLTFSHFKYFKATMPTLIHFIVLKTAFKKKNCIKHKFYVGGKIIA